MTKPGDPEKGKAAEAEQAEQAAKESTEAKAVEDAELEAEATEEDAPAEEKPKPARKPRAKKAEATAAAETGEQKDAAEAATKEGSSEPVKQRKRTARPAPGERAVVRAQAKYVRTSARKARLVCDHIRGKDVVEARAILAHTPRAVSEAWSKLLESAVANAEHNHELVGDDLKILSVTADEGPTLKRFRPRAMGRATKIRKRTSHLTIELTAKE